MRKLHFLPRVVILHIATAPNNMEHCKIHRHIGWSMVNAYQHVLRGIFVCKSVHRAL